MDPCHLVLAVCTGASCGKAWRDKAWGSTTVGHLDSRAAWPSSGSFLLWALRLLLSTCCAHRLLHPGLPLTALSMQLSFSTLC